MSRPSPQSFRAEYRLRFEALRRSDLYRAICEWKRTGDPLPEDWQRVIARKTTLSWSDPSDKQPPPLRVYDIVGDVFTQPFEEAWSSIATRLPAAPEAPPAVKPWTPASFDGMYNALCSSPGREAPEPKAIEVRDAIKDLKGKKYIRRQRASNPPSPERVSKGLQCLAAYDRWRAAREEGFRMGKRDDPEAGFPPPPLSCSWSELAIRAGTTSPGEPWKSGKDAGISQVRDRVERALLIISCAEFNRHITRNTQPARLRKG